MTLIWGEGYSPVITDFYHQESRKQVAHGVREGGRSKKIIFNLCGQKGRQGGGDPKKSSFKCRLWGQEWKEIKENHVQHVVRGVREGGRRRSQKILRSKRPVKHSKPIWPRFANNQLQAQTIIISCSLNHYRRWSIMWFYHLVSSYLELSADCWYLDEISGGGV